MTLHEINLEKNEIREIRKFREEEDYLYREEFMMTVTYVDVSLHESKFRSDENLIR